MTVPQATVAAMRAYGDTHGVELTWDVLEGFLQAALDRGEIVPVRDLETDEPALVPKAYLDGLREVVRAVLSEWYGEHPGRTERDEVVEPLLERLRQEVER